MKCNRCQLENPSGKVFCPSCNNQLMGDREALAVLHNAIHEIETNYRDRISEVKNDIVKLRYRMGEKPVVVSESLRAEVAETKQVASPEPEKKTNTKEAPSAPVIKPKRKATADKPVIPREPSVFEKQISELFRPVTDGLSWVQSRYLHYKKEGKLPIFLMTAAGILAMLFGLGYLMQVTLDRMGVYEPVIKIGMGFLASLSFAVIGLRLYKREDHYQEYATSLAGLSIVINYLLIYFLADLGNFPLLSSAATGFVFILINTAFAVFLSLKFETRIMAILCLLGGALAPFFLNSTEDSTFYYGYLWFLVAAANYIAFKIGWKALHYISFTVSVTLMGLTVFSNPPSTALFYVYYHLFAYLFFYFIFFENFRWKRKLEKPEVILLAGNLTFFVYSLYASFGVTGLMTGLTYVGNALFIAGFTYVRWQKMSVQIRRILPVIVATLLALAIPAIFDRNLTGLFWSLEAMLLIHLGFTTRIPIVRNEGYLLLLVGIFKILESTTGFIADFDGLAHDGYLNLSALGLVLSLLWWQLFYYRRLLTGLESKLYYVFRNGFSLWVAAWFMTTGWFIVGNFIFSLAVVPLFGLIVWGNKLKSTLLMVSGMLFLMPLLGAFFKSASETNSLFFDEQKLYAQLSLAILLLSLYFVKPYMRLIKQQKPAVNSVAHMLRVTFYVVIPFIPISFARRNYEEFTLTTAWVSLLIPYFFYKKLQYKALIIQYILMITVIFALSFGDISNHLLITAVLVMVVLLIAEKAYRLFSFHRSPIKIILIILPYAIALFIATLTARILNIGLAPAALFFLLILVSITQKNKLVFIRPGMQIAITMTVIIGTLITFLSVLLNEGPEVLITSLINVLLLGYILSNSQKWYGKILLAKWAFDMSMLQLYIFAVYLTAIQVLEIPSEGATLTVLMAIHAVTLLFLALKTGFKLLNYLSVTLFSFATLKIVFFDIASLPATQKVIVLIVLGIILLAASYAYTRLKKNFDARASDELPEGESPDKEEVKHDQVS